MQAADPTVTAHQIALLAGSDFWHTVPLPKHDLPAVRVSDGPNGVRGVSCKQAPALLCRLPRSAALTLP